MDKSKIKAEKRTRRHNRIRARISGNSEVPRLNVFKSNTAVYAQIIDDSKGVTIASSSTKKVKGANMFEKSTVVGQEIARIAKDKGINKVVFDRGGYIYTGKVKALAEGAREAGLEF